MSTESLESGEKRLRRLVVGLTGASGASVGIRLLEALAAAGVETHLVVSDWGRRTIELETPFSVDEVLARAGVVYECRDMGAAIASGSFQNDGMIVAPCSMKTLSAIANGYSDNLIARAAEVAIKEGRRLIVAPREAPLSAIHLRNMLALAELGVRVVPPMLSFYAGPQTLDDAIDFAVGKLLDAAAVPHDLFKRWQGEGV